MWSQSEKLKFTIPPDYDKCFGCGQANPVGLKLRFQNDNGVAKASFTPGPEYQGWEGILHGGVMCAALDEALGYAAYFRGIKAVTGKLEVHFRKPVPVRSNLTLTAWITRETKRFLVAKAKAAFEDGSVAADATAILFVVP
ncbi:MAG: PaaI family thioesterase [Chloroflexi bacterium]|nr:MAG: PaaI family thioesterase [Chloroflexota bacterium]HDN79587.1 PaaI family thioesterase [Chloroflexota bacterium]